MRKEIRILMIALILIVGSAGVFALERIDKTDGGYETYDATTKTWSIYVEGLEIPAHTQALEADKWNTRTNTLGRRGEIKTVTTPPAPASPPAAGVAETPKEQTPAQTSHQDKAGSTVTPANAKPDKLRELIIAKGSTQQDLATAQNEYQKAQATKEKAREGYDAALARENAAIQAWAQNPSAENMAAVNQAKSERKTWETLNNLAVSELVEKQIKAQDAELGLKQKESELNKEYALREAGTPLGGARLRQETYRNLLAKETQYETDQEKLEKEITQLRQYINKIGDEEEQETELKEAKARLEGKEKELATLEENAEKNKEEIERLTPVNNYDAAVIRLAEIDRTLTEINTQTGPGIAAAQQEYNRVQQERIDAQKAIKTELEAPEIKSEYDQIKAIPEKDRTVAQKILIENYEYKLEEYTAALKDWTAQEAKAKTELETKQKESIEKIKDLEKEKAEVTSVKETFKLKKDIAQLDTEIANLQKQRAEAIKEGDTKKKEKLDKEIEEKMRKKEKKQDDLNWKERNWSGRTIYMINKFMQSYEEYKGINQWSSLWMSDEELAKKRQNAALKFCNEIILLANTACWQSKICDGLFPREPPASQNTLITEIGVGGYTPAAAIQADKSFPMPYAEAGKTKTKHVYKITYFMENPHMDQELTYYIELRGDRTFKSPESRLGGRTLEKMGGKEGRLGSDPMIFESEYNYENACIVFSPRILKANGGYANEICSPIKQYSGAATRPYTLPPATQAAVQNSTGTTPGVSMAGA